MEADERHLEKLMDRFGLDDTSKGFESSDLEDHEGSEATEFRRLAATLNYYAQDCPELTFAANEAARSREGENARL